MSIESYSQILEEELSEAVEVKNPKSLHRYIVLLSENLVEKRQYHEEQTGIKSDLKEMMLLMRERFEAMDRRFEDTQHQMNTRFEDMQQQMNARFEAVDKRFEDMQQQMNSRFEAVDKRFEDTQQQMNTRFEAVDKRFDDMNKRFTSLTWLISIGFVAINALIIIFKFFYP